MKRYNGSNWQRNTIYRWNKGTVDKYIDQTLKNNWLSKSEIQRIYTILI